MKFNQLISELKRRNVYQVAVAYVVTAWIILQVASIILPTLEAPNWVMKTVLLLLLVGLPAVLVFSWVYEITPEGLKRTENVEQASSITPKTRKRLNWLIIGALSLAITVLILDRFRIKRGIQAASQSIANINISPIPKSIREKKVAVMVFDNQTNDEDLESFGAMISDWLTEGLMEVSEGKVIGFNNIEQNMKLAGLTNSPTPAFAKATKAEVVVQGRYYLQEDDLIVYMNIVDAYTGEIIYAFDPFIKERSNLSALLDDMTQRLLGYWALSNKTRFKKKAPKYNAYKIYQHVTTNLWNTERPKSIDELNKAYKLDTTFYEALFRIAVQYRNMNEIAKSDSVLNLIKQHNPILTKTESLRLQSTEHLNRGEFLKAAQVYEKMFEIDSTNRDAYHNIGLINLRENYPNKLIRFYESYDPANFNEEGKRNRMTDYLTLAYFRSGHYQKVCRLANSHYRPGISDNIIGAQIRALVRLDSLDRIDHYLNFYKKQEDPNTIKRLYRDLCEALFVTGKHELKRHYAQEMIEIVEGESNPNPELLARAYFFRENYDKAIEILENDFTNTPDAFESRDWYWGNIGSLALLNGDTTKAKKMLNNIQEEEGFYYQKAKLFIQFGEFDKAVATLKKSPSIFLDRYNYLHDPLFLPIKGYPPYEELFEPND